MTEWISVQERLPEEDDEVLVVVKAAHQSFVTALYRKNDEWLQFWNHESVRSIIYERVSHWMPLPDPPKENQ